MITGTRRGRAGCLSCSTAFEVLMEMMRVIQPQVRRLARHHPNRVRTARCLKAVLNWGIIWGTTSNRSQPQLASPGQSPGSPWA